MISLAHHFIAFCRNLFFDHDIQELWGLVVVLSLLLVCLIVLIIYNIYANSRIYRRILTNRRIAKVIEQIPIPIVVCQYEEKARHSAFVTSRSVYANKLSSELLGQMTIQDLRHRFTPSTVGALQQIVHETVRTKTSQKHLLKMELRSGHTLFYVIQLVPFSLHQLDYYLAVAIDVGELYAHDFSTQIFRQEKLTFLHNVSSYIGEPLHRIVDMSILLTTMKPSNQREHLAQELTLENQRLLNIVENILLYAKIESGTVLNNLSWFDGVAVMKERENVYKSWVPKDKQIVITMEHPYEKLNIQLDLLYFATSLNRLVENAILHADSPVIRVGYFVYDHMFYMWCRDIGKGISQSEQIRVYERFYKSDSNSSRAGMGLALNRIMCEALHGATGMVSEEGQGTFAWIALPMTIDSELSLSYDNEKIQKMLQLRTKGIWFDAFTSDNIKCYGIRQEKQYIIRNDGSLYRKGGHSV